MTFHSMSPTEVQAIIAQGGPVDLIDVRSGLEFANVHAVGARHVPLGSLDPAQIIASRVGRKDDPIYCICQSGGRSAAACQRFIDHGFTNVVNVSGGTGAWVAANLPVERGRAAPVIDVLRQTAVFAAVAGLMLAIMPCSPWSLWGAGACPTQPSSSFNTVPITPAQASLPLDFQRDVVEASRTRPVLVDFHATWCGPCRMLGPEIEALAQERAGRMDLTSIDVDRHPQVAQEQQVEGIPDVRLWHGGREVARFVGYRDRAAIAAWVDQHAKAD